jgi:hypothetical protein
MPENLSNKEQQDNLPVGKRQQIDDDPLNTNFSNAAIPGDPVEPGPEKEEGKTLGEEETHLGDNRTDQYQPASPKAGLDGIRDGDLEANDAIGGERLVTE